MFKKSIILGFFLILICFYSIRTDSANCPFCCKRKATLEDFINKNNPDFDERQDEWMKCMNSQLKGWSSFDPDDPKVKKARADCKYLEPESWEYIYPSLVRSKLIQTFTTEYFHLLQAGHPEKKPEYAFKGSYEVGLSEKSDVDGQPVTSRFILELYFNGNPQEQIKTWATEKKIDNPVPAHLRSMFTNRDAKTRQDRPIHELLRDFEKRPEKCDINPDKEELFPGQEIKVKISNIVDFEGRKSREFNRIVVQAVKGEIIGGTTLVSDPELKAFQVGKEDITFTYVAPDEENSQATEDKIVIYNSCDILRKDEYPMPKTELKDKIAEKKIKLIRSNYAIAKITEKYEAICEEGGHTLSAKLNVVLKYSHTESSVEYYDTVSWNVRGTGSWIVFNTDHVEKSKKIPGKLLIFFDSETGKATRIVFPDYEYSFIFDTPYGIVRKGQIGVTDSARYVKGGDGIHEMEGRGTDVVDGPCRLKSTAKWNIKRYK